MHRRDGAYGRILYDGNILVGKLSGFLELWSIGDATRSCEVLVGVEEGEEGGVPEIVERAIPRCGGDMLGERGVERVNQISLAM